MILGSKRSKLGTVVYGDIEINAWSWSFVNLQINLIIIRYFLLLIYLNGTKVSKSKSVIPILKMLFIIVMYFCIFVNKLQNLVNCGLQETPVELMVPGIHKVPWTENLRNYEQPSTKE